MAFFKTKNMATPSKLVLHIYKITSDPREADNGMHYSSEMEELLNKTYAQVKKQKFRNPQWLLALIEKYPNVPAFKNYLTVFYNLKGNKEKTRSSNQWLAKEHPDYLYGKLNIAAGYIEDGLLEEVPKVLGEALDLQALYPERKVFHITEFQSFLNVSCNYLIQNGELEAVETRLEPADKILGEDNPVIQGLRAKIHEKKEELLWKKWERMEEERGGREIGRSHDESVQTTVPPTFQHPEILELYRHGMDIEHQILRDILALPRETLLQDLETVLRDSLCRFDFFSDNMDEAGDWQAEATSFPLHALLLLTELRATEKLPLLLDHLRQGDAFLEFWYSDHTTETLWQFIYHLGQEQLELLKDFVLERDVHYSAKWIVLNAASQMGQHLPAKKQEVLDWFKAVAQHFIENHEDAFLADPVVGAHIVCDLCDLQAVKLLPEIKQMYELGLVEEEIPGSYQSVEHDIKKRHKNGYKVYSNIFDHYDHITEKWASYKTDEDLEIKADALRKQLGITPAENIWSPSEKNISGQYATLKNTTPKVGRNDPCPCGSGKKYKKCCG